MQTTTTKCLTVSRSDFEIHRVIDPDPDLSCLGTYANHHTADGLYIDRVAQGDCGSARELRYWIASGIRGPYTPDSLLQDYNRMETYNNGDWHCLGIYAAVDICIAGTIQTIRSPGLWGIESDSSQEYLNEIGGEEKAQLESILLSMGFEVTD